MIDVIVADVDGHVADGESIIERIVADDGVRDSAGARAARLIVVCDRAGHLLRRVPSLRRESQRGEIHLRLAPRRDPQDDIGDRLPAQGDLVAARSPLHQAEARGRQDN